MVFGGLGGGEATGVAQTGYAGAVRAGPPKPSFSRQTKHHRHRHRHRHRPRRRPRPRPRHRYRNKSLGYGAWCLTPTHTVAQSAVADNYNYKNATTTAKRQFLWFFKQIFRFILKKIELKIV